LEGPKANVCVCYWLGSRGIKGGGRVFIVSLRQAKTWERIPLCMARETSCQGAATSAGRIFLSELFTSNGPDQSSNRHRALSNFPGGPSSMQTRGYVCFHTIAKTRNRGQESSSRDEVLRHWVLNFSRQQGVCSRYSTSMLGEVGRGGSRPGGRIIP
jgi:hypothetical protein